MVYQKFCYNCKQRHQCQQVYEHLGKADGPSVVSKVVTAFLLPLVVFIVTLAVYNGLAARTGKGFLDFSPQVRLCDTRLLQQLLGLLAATVATAVWIFLTMLIRKRFVRR